MVFLNALYTGTGRGAFQNSSWRSPWFSPGPDFTAHSSAPVVAYLAPAPAVSESLPSVIEYFSPAPAVFQAPAHMVEFIAPEPVVSLSPPPLVEYISPAPAEITSPSPVEESSSPVPAVSQSPMPISPAPAVSRVVESGLHPWRRGGGIQGPVPPLVAELFALGELPRRTSS